MRKRVLVRNKYTVTVTSLIIMFLLYGYTGKAQTATDFSGDWTLNLSKSKLEAKWTSGIEKGSVKIRHTDPDFYYWRSFIINGIDDTLSFSLQTNGQEKIEQTGIRKTITSLSWNHDTLQYVTRIIIGNKEAVNLVKYYLKPNDLEFVTDEEFIGPKTKYHNIWGYDKIGSPGSDK